jgi:hypothetical protein
MITCAYCSAPAFTAGTTNPPMCEQHFDIALIRAALTRNRYVFTVGNVISEMRRKMAADDTRFSFTPDQAPALVRQVMDAETIAMLATMAPAHA